MKFSKISLERLATCDERLQRVFAEVIKHYDCAILCGHRGKDEQNAERDAGRSKLSWPMSKHNTMPSRAVDAAPWPLDWNDRERFALFAGFVRGIAMGMGIRLRLGADFNTNGRTKDDGWDMPHFELEDP